LFFTISPIKNSVFSTFLDSYILKIEILALELFIFMPDIVDIAVSSDSFETLVTAVKAAGLVETLKSPGPFTVFAPTDEAFAKLPPGTIQTLVQNIPQLARILTYHVVPGKLMKADLEKVDTVTSVEGSPISIDCTDNFEVKNATVVAADLEADNGVIHVIDNVILMG
jgi:uncharacterized surface protein with fasciclin (FAS1) repeats